MNHLFRITQIDANEARRVEANPSEPHAHDYETLIVGIAGSLEHFVDFKSTLVVSPLVSFIARGKVHRIITHPVKGEFNMWVIRFKSEFIAETVFHLYSTYHDNANQMIPDGTCFNRLDAICKLIDGEMGQIEPDLAIVKHLLSALLMMIESERTKAIAESSTSEDKITRNETFVNFLAILESNFYRPLGVDFYAEKLFMTSRNLNIICQNIVGQSVSELIETRKLTEAKNLLMTTNKSVSEIGFELGYNEKSYFSNVFKKKSGQTPTEFRDEMRKLIS
jgi:AraC-like DNA-binding protein